MTAKQSRLLATMERKKKLMSGAREKFQPPGPKISKVDIELFETSEEMRGLVVEKRSRNGGAEGF